MKRDELKQKGHFLVFNKGNNRKKLFYAEDDFARFIKTALLFQYQSAIPNLHRKLKPAKFPALSGAKTVELLAYRLDPHHFELILYQNEPERISKYMQRLMTSYTKYYNQRYNHEGALFRGAYKLDMIESHSVQNKISNMYDTPIHYTTKEGLDEGKLWESLSV